MQCAQSYIQGTNKNFLHDVWLDYSGITTSSTTVLVSTIFCASYVRALSIIPDLLSFLFLVSIAVFVLYFQHAWLEALKRLTHHFWYTQNKRSSSRHTTSSPKKKEVMKSCLFQLSSPHTVGLWLAGTWDLKCCERQNNSKPSPLEAEEFLLTSLLPT